LFSLSIDSSLNKAEEIEQACKDDEDSLLSWIANELSAQKLQMFKAKFRKCQTSRDRKMTAQILMAVGGVAGAQIEADASSLEMGEDGKPLSYKRQRGGDDNLDGREDVANETELLKKIEIVFDLYKHVNGDTTDLTEPARTWYRKSCKRIGICIESCHGGSLTNFVAAQQEVPNGSKFLPQKFSCPQCLAAASSKSAVSLKSVIESPLFSGV
jgi:hypothetical protein